MNALQGKCRCVDAMATRAADRAVRVAGCASYGVGAVAILGHRDLLIFRWREFYLDFTMVCQGVKVEL